ncbi:ABC transporter ATP-binding protein [Alteromonas sp. D210916BOD_24]|uniref:ABC transporter ATP-binding protein n=1 Tax=Alteromonas sp. D210916BOD_24 TaxID=3157618 RepID=UPI00399C9645
MITLHAIGKSFDGESGKIDVLNNLSLRVEKSEFVSLLGRSGEGKSTLLNILGGFDQFDSGSYQFDEMEISELNSSQLTDFRMCNIGFVFQSFHLIKHLTIRKNVELPLLLRKVSESERKQRALAMLERLNIADKADCYPRQLSGGQCQRVAIARALVGKPGLILADEPTGALDRETADSILDLFKQLNSEGHTIIMVTHDPAVAQKAHKAFELTQGKLVRKVYEKH